MERANWRAPEGPGSDLDGRADHPVVHVSWNDANAYALGRQAAADGGRMGIRSARRPCAGALPWGDELTADGRGTLQHLAGPLPAGQHGWRTASDHRARESLPAERLRALQHVRQCLGMVRRLVHRRRTTQRPPPDPTGPPHGVARVMRGGSYLCHESYCNRYRVAARTSNTPDSSGGHLGFRCVRDLPAPQ